MMESLKKYLWLVIGGAVGLVLLIVACIFLFLHIQQYRSDTSSADDEQNRLDLLQKRPLAGPTEENVQIISTNNLALENCLKKILAQLRQSQVEPRKMQPVDFNSYLKSTIDQMNDDAKTQELLMPAKFDYGFKTYYVEGRLPSVNSVPRLTIQVQLVKALMDILRKAKVTEVSGIEREVFEQTALAAAAEMPPGSGVLKPAVTNLSTVSAQLYTREHFRLTLRIRDEMIAGLLNALAQDSEAESPRLFVVVTKLDLIGPAMPKATTSAESRTAVAAPSGEKAAEPKKREDRIVAGREKVTLLMDVDIYRFAGETGEKTKP